jgi:hypothetical protein
MTRHTITATGKAKMEILKTKSWPDLGLQMELLMSPAGIPTIRMMDTDAEKVFGIIQFSRVEMAEARFAEEVAKAEKNLYPVDGLKMEGAVKEQQPTTKGE